MNERLARLEAWRSHQALEDGLVATRACLARLTLPELRAAVTAERRRLQGYPQSQAERAASARWREAFSDAALEDAVRRIAKGDGEHATKDAAMRLLLAAIGERVGRTRWGSA